MTAAASALATPVERLRRMMLIRAFEAALAARADHGFQLLSSGEEAVAVGVCAALRDGDQLLSSGRSIGPALARGVDPRRLMAELLGKQRGTNRGKAGRGHLADPAAGFFGAHAVVAGNISVAAGVALAKQLDADGSIVAVIFGDGACGAGVLHETLNLAAIWRLPLLFVCDNNQLSVSTRRDDVLALRRLSDLGTTFGMPSCTVDGTDVRAVADAAASAARHVRGGNGPAFVECVAYRMMKHSTNARESRSAADLADARRHCPIERERATLRTAGVIDDEACAALDVGVATDVAAAVAFADASPYPTPEDVLDDVG